MNFLEEIFANLARSPNRPVLGEVHDGHVEDVTCRSFLSFVRKGRGFLAAAGLKKGDRCALLANNSIRWAAMDLACMSEGVIVVPLYARQAPAELIGMMKDCTPSLICCGDASLRDGIKEWAEAPPISMLDDIFAPEARPGDAPDAPASLSEADPVTIIYTSGTSGEPKGVILNVANLSHMLCCVNARLDLLMGPRATPDQVFHYLPFCFAGSWILLLTSLKRNSFLTMSTDLAKLADEMRVASPDYFLNVPALVERVRSGIEDGLRKKGGFALSLFEKGRAAWLRKNAPSTDAARGGSLLDGAVIAVANAVVFRTIRKKVGPNVKALICGSAPLAKETQLFFMMLGIPVLQVYGLTETTAICTMDDPERVTPGRVGPATSGVEMKVGEGDEILVKGPNIFPGYWNRPAETEKAFSDGWFRTGDLGEVDQAGNWSITGRLKNLIILSSGHNVAPEPIEEALARAIPGAQQVVLFGTGRGFLSALVTGEVDPSAIDTAIETVNSDLPHYKRIRSYYLHREPFSIENGLLTANGKLRREAIGSKFQSEMDSLYAPPTRHAHS